MATKSKSQTPSAPAVDHPPPPSRRKVWTKLLRWIAKKALQAEGWTLDTDGRWYRVRMARGHRITIKTWEADAVRRVLELP